MIEKKPMTREHLLKLLELPENAELKASIEAMPQHKDLVIDLVILIDKHFDSIEDFKKSFDEYVQMKKTVIA